MSQSDKPQVDEVKRLLGRIQRLGQEADLAEPDPRREPSSGGYQWAPPMPEARQELEGPNPTDLQYPTPAIAGEEQYAVRDGRLHVGSRLRVPAIAAICALAAALGIFLAVTIRNQQIVNTRPGESQPEVAMAVQPKPSSPPLVTHEAQPDVASASVASAPRLVVPAEWSAPAGVATRLPMAVEPYEEAGKYQVLMSGLETSAFVVKGTEIIQGTWMVPGDDLASAMVVRDANAPGRATVAFELRTEAGEVLSRAEVILLANPASK